MWIIRYLHHKDEGQKICFTAEQLRKVLLRLYSLPGYEVVEIREVLL